MFKPDVIYAHPWGRFIVFKDIFYDVHLINICEWYYRSENSNMDLVKKLNEDRKAKTRTMNAQLLISLLACNKDISPTNWQKPQFE